MRSGGEVSLAVAALGLAFLMIHRAVTDVDPMWWSVPVVLLGTVSGLISENRRLARHGLPFTWT